MNLITGGTGLVGTHLLYDLVVAGEPVRAIKRENSDLEMVRKIFRFYTDNGDELFDRIEWVNANILDVYELEDAMQGIEYVYHSAALVSFGKKDVEKLYKVNIEGTANVVNVALDAGIKKLCHVSSTAAIGRAKSGAQIDENTQWKTSPLNTNYAVSKFGAEREVWRANEEGLQTVIVNPSIIIGPGDASRSTGRMFTTMSKGLKYYTEGINGFVDVRDVSRAMIALMKSDVSSERFLTVGQNMPYRELFDLIATSIDQRKPWKKATPFMTNLAWRMAAFRAKFSRKDPIITRETAWNSQKQYFYSTEKIKNALDFEFTSIEEAVENAGRFFVQQKS
jgi:dihydroflavonol-4-reductase